MHSPRPWQRVQSMCRRVAGVGRLLIVFPRCVVVSGRCAASRPGRLRIGRGDGASMSAAKVSSALRAMRAVPSGWRHEPRPSMTPIIRLHLLEEPLVDSAVGEIVEQPGQLGQAVEARPALAGALPGEVVEDVCGAGEPTLVRLAARG